jgi:hypothetical protein
MNTDETIRLLRETIKVTREDIARAKAWLVQTEGGATQKLVEQWLTPQQAVVVANATVDLNADDSAEQIAKYARAFSLKLAFYQAQWELIAAAEATWIECGIAVAKQLSNTKLAATMSDPYASINKKIAKVQKTLQSPDGKALLKRAGRTTADVDNAEIWTTNLRERRNALHWGKAKSFVADHSETASLMMGAPLHIGTLEAIRTVA